MKQALLKKLRARDSHCPHCGVVDDLVPHHRMNRGMGGSKTRDRLDNLLLVCAVYNGLMESDAAVAERARQHGHKLWSWQGFETPVWDEWMGLWYVLDEAGGREATRR